MKTPIITLIKRFSLTLITIGCVSATAQAVDYTFTGTSTLTWNNPILWSSSAPGTYPDDITDNVVGNTTFTVAQINGTYTIGNFASTGNSDGAWTVRTTNVASSPGSLTINGTLTVGSAAQSSRMNFTSQAVTGTTGVTNNLDLTVNGMTTIYGGVATGTSGNATIAAFGSSSVSPAPLALGSLSLNGLTLNSTGGGVSVTMGVMSDYSLGVVSAVSNTSGKTLTLNVNSAATRIVTVSGLSGVTTTAIAIQSGNNVAHSGTAVLTINNTSDYTSNALLRDGSGATDSLALVKTGSATQTLVGASEFTGGTTVSAGTLLVNNTTNSGLGTGAVAVNGGTLGGTGSFSGAVTVNSGGTLAPGASIESLGTGSITFDGGNLGFEINTTAGTADLVYGGNNSTLTLLGVSTVSFSDLGSGTTLALGTKFTLISYDGAWNGGVFTGYADDSTFSFAGNTWQINYNDTSAGTNFTSNATAFGTSFVTMTTVVPEPSTWALLGLGLIALLTFRKRQLLRR